MFDEVFRYIVPSSCITSPLIEGLYEPVDFYGAPILRLFNIVIRSVPDKRSSSSRNFYYPCYIILFM